MVREPASQALREWSAEPPDVSSFVPDDEIVADLADEIAEIPTQIEAELGPAEWPSCTIPLTASALSLLRSAVVEAAKLRHRYVGTEHVLLALTREAEPTQATLRRAGVDLDALRHRLIEMTARAELRLSEALREYFELSEVLRSMRVRDIDSIRSKFHTDVLDAMNAEYNAGMSLAREAAELVEQALDQVRRELDLNGAGTNHSGHPLSP